MFKSSITVMRDGIREFTSLDTRDTIYEKIGYDKVKITSKFGQYPSFSLIISNTSRTFWVRDGEVTDTETYENIKFNGDVISYILNNQENIHELGDVMKCLRE